MKLYVIYRAEKGCRGYSKVGISSKPIARLKELEYSGGFAADEFVYFDVPDDKATSMERAAHEKLAEYRLSTSFNGQSEWFKCDFSEALGAVLGVLYESLVRISDRGVEIDLCHYETSDLITFPTNIPKALKADIAMLSSESIAGTASWAKKVMEMASELLFACASYEKVSE